MNDPYTIALVGVGATIIGTCIGALLTYWLTDKLNQRNRDFQKELHKSTQEFQRNLAEQNEALQKQQHEDQLKKIHEFGSAMYNKLHDLMIAIRDK